MDCLRPNLFVHNGAFGGLMIFAFMFLMAVAITSIGAIFTDPFSLGMGLYTAYLAGKEWSAAWQLKEKKEGG